MQGDVIGIVDNSGTKVVEYTYDEWGKLLATTGTLATTIGTLNPFRYRGYYYDTETGFYYCRARYYDPEICRWLNADNVIAGVGGLIQGYNMFAYCFNNPINMIDEIGDWPSWKKIKKALKIVVDDVVKIGKSIIKSFSVEIEAGFGVGANVQVCDSVNVSVLAVVNRDKFSIDNGEANLTTEMEYSVGVEIGEFIDLAPSATCSVDYYDVKKGNGFYSNSKGEWTFDSSLSDDVVFSIGASIYLGLGLGFDVSFNLSECIQMIME